MAGVPSARVRRLLHLPSELAGRLDATRAGRRARPQAAGGARRRGRASSRSTRARRRARASSPGRARCPRWGRPRTPRTVVALPTTAPLRGSLAVRPRAGAAGPAGRRGPGRAGRPPRRDGRRVGLAARGGPAPPRVAGLPRRHQRAAGAVARRRADRRGRAAGRGAPARGVVRGAPGRRRRAGCGWPRSPTPTRTGCPSCARRSTARLTRSPELRAGLAGLLAGMSGPVRFAAADRRRRRAARPRTATTLGTLTVGRPLDRPHEPRGRRAHRRRRPPRRAGRAQRPGHRRARAGVAGAAAGAAAARAPGGPGPGPGRGVPPGEHGQRRGRRLLRRLRGRPRRSGWSRSATCAAPAPAPRRARG